MNVISDSTDSVTVSYCRQFPDELQLDTATEYY